MDSFRAAVLLSLASLVTAQFGGGNGGGFGGNNNPYNNGGNNNDNSSGFFGNSFFASSSRQRIVIAHGVLASLAFVLLFPVGAIIVRLGNFRGLWLVHGLFQAFAYLIYIAAFGIGVYMARNLRMLDRAHPIIGIVLFVVLLFQPVLGLLHHFMFKKHSRRVVWSYGHIWLGRIAITLGIINGGLGLQLAQRSRISSPSRGAIIAYSVVAAVMWLLYVGAAIFGEIRRSRAQKQGLPPPYKEGSPDTQPGAPNGVGEYYKNQRSGNTYA